MNADSHEILNVYKRRDNTFTDYSRMRIRDDEDVDDGFEWIPVKSEDVDTVIGILTAERQASPVFIISDYTPRLTAQQKDKCASARVFPIVLLEEISDCRPTRRVFRNCVDGLRYLDYFEEGYGSADDAATVWIRKIERED